jgi:hypothetical protein
MKPLTPAIAPEHPFVVLLHNQDREYAAIRVTDGSDFTHEEEAAFTGKHKNYAVADPPGKYFYLTLEEIHFREIPEENDEIAGFMANLLQKAGDFWYDHYTASLN